MYLTDGQFQKCSGVASEVRHSPLNSFLVVRDLQSEVSWLIEDRIPGAGCDGCWPLRAGPAKSTFGVRDLREQSHTGEEFLGRKTVRARSSYRRTSRELLFCGPASSRADRLGIVRLPSRLYFWRRRRARAGRSELVLALGGLAQRKGVIIFDSLVAFHPGSEQDSSETRKYMDGFRSLASAGATVIVIHHSGKSEGSKEYRVVAISKLVSIPPFT